MAFPFVHGMQIVKGGFITNAVVETLSAPLSGEELNEAQVGRVYAADNKIWGVVEVDGSKKNVDLTSTYVYTPVMSSPLLSGATTAEEADEILSENIVELITKTDEHEEKITDLTDKVNDLSENSETFVYESESPLTTHTIQHNFASNYVDAMVWVKNVDTNKYTADIVEVEVTDENTVTVDLAEARDIRVVVRKAVKTATA